MGGRKDKRHLRRARTRYRCPDMALGNLDGMSGTQPREEVGKESCVAGRVGAAKSLSGPFDTEPLSSHERQ